MSNFPGMIPALIGVLVGAGAAGLTDMVRWKRSQAVRWDERRVAAYAEYARAIKRIHMTALGMLSPHRAERINREDGLAMLAQADSQRTEAWEGVLLLADRETTDAAFQWQEIVRNEAEFARNRPDDGESDDWKAAVRNADEARDSFYVAARKSVNVGGGSVAIAQLLLSAGQRGGSQEAQERRAVRRADL
jgi:hypothetical protein